MRLATRRTSRLGAVTVALALISPVAAEAHCDSLDGPVITEARAALEAGDVTPVLKWVSQDDEAEIRAVFDHVVGVRELGGEARSLADRFFFETLVRIHRASEGAPYAGLKPAGSGLYAVEGEADAALAAGSVDELAHEIAERASAGVRGRFASAIAARERADESVEAGREYVEAYVDYVHFVLGVHYAITGPGSRHHGAGEPQSATEAGHGH